MVLCLILVYSTNEENFLSFKTFYLNKVIIANVKWKKKDIALYNLFLDKMRNSGPLVIIMHENLTCTCRKGFEQINSDIQLLKAEIYWRQMTENTRRTHFLYESLCFRSALISTVSFLVSIYLYPYSLFHCINYLCLKL